MTNVEQVIGQVSLATQAASEGLAGFQQGKTKMEEAAQAFQQASQGTNQSEASDVTQLFQKAAQAADEALQAALQAISSAESFAGRL